MEDVVQGTVIIEQDNASSLDDHYHHRSSSSVASPLEVLHMTEVDEADNSRTSSVDGDDEEGRDGSDDIVVDVVTASSSSSGCSSVGSSSSSRSPEPVSSATVDESSENGSPNHSMVDLTEEAEEDLANNNDPNNNASSGDGPPMHDANLFAAVPASLGGENEMISLSDSSALDLYEVNSFVESEMEESRLETIRQELERDARLILKLMPNRSFDEVHNYLEAHLEKPSRVQIVLNEFLEQAEQAAAAVVAEKSVETTEPGGVDESFTPSPTEMQRPDREYSPEPTFKNKAGNGMKSKNRVNKTATATATSNDVPANGIATIAAPPAAAAAATTAATSGASVGLSDRHDHAYPGVGGEPAKPALKKKRPLLDLNLEAHAGLDALGGGAFDDVNVRAAAPKKSRPNLDRDDYDPQEGSSRDHAVTAEGSPEDAARSVAGGGGGEQRKINKGASSTATSNSSKRSDKLIALSESHFYGPFDFKSHRPQMRKIADRRFDGIRDDLNEIIVESSRSGSSSRSGGGGSGTATPRSLPEVVDIDIGSPPVVDLSQSDQNEKNELLANLVTMFPDTPQEYLAEQAEELAGKHVATERFITELLSRNSQPPDYWTPNVERMPFVPDFVNNLNAAAAAVGAAELLDEAAYLEPGTSAADAAAPPPPQQPPEPESIDLTLADPAEPRPGPSNAKDEDLNVPETEEDKIAGKWSTLQILFPQTDPEFLHLKIVEFVGNEEALNRWIEEGIESKGRDFPTKAQYEKRQQEAEMLDKYSQEVTVQEILDMYSDPETYFGDKTRKVSELYKKHALAQLKKEFRNLNAVAINKAFSNHNGLYYPSFKALQKGNGAKRKTKRPDHECSRPQEIDINFLKELQFSRIEGDVKQHKENLSHLRQERIKEAEKRDELMECVCCYNDQCLMEEMLPCKSGHLYCVECVQRASEVAIGEGKTRLLCLGQCDESFDLSVLQRALRANIFSKWLVKIQLNEVREAIPDGLECCPFCEFVAIMDTSPEENKILQCQNPDCGKETCRLCKEISHIPLRCDEVEKDSEVRKRTYIENKMTEALIRKCWKCQKPFYKVDGCNKMTCECGAQMCYLCRQPVRDYKHFYGQGAQPTDGQTCPLWSDNKRLHESDVARGALEAKSEMDEKVPEVRLKHDPTLGVVPPADMQPADLAAVAAAAHGPGVEAILGNDPLERARIIQQQQQIEELIRRQHQHQQQHHHHHHGFVAGVGQPGGLAGAGMGQPPGLPEHDERQWQDGFMHRMGELLQLREAQRMRQRAIRRRELEALEDFHIYYQHPAAAGAAPDGAVAVPQIPAAAGTAAAAAAAGANAHFGGQLFVAAGGERGGHNNDAQRNIQRRLNPNVFPPPPPPPLGLHHVHHHHHRGDPHFFHMPGPVPPPAHQMNVGGADHRRPHQAEMVAAVPTLQVRPFAAMINGNLMGRPHDIHGRLLQQQPPPVQIVPPRPPMPYAVAGPHPPRAHIHVGRQPVVHQAHQPLQLAIIRRQQQQHQRQRLMEEKHRLLEQKYRLRERQQQQQQQNPPQQHQQQQPGGVPQGLPPPVPELDPTEVADILGNRNRPPRRAVAANNAAGIFRAPPDDVVDDPMLFDINVDLDDVLDHLDL